MISSLKFRRYLSRVTLPFLTIWLCVLPSKSYAVAPVLALLPIAAEFIAADGTAVVLSQTSAFVNLVGMTLASFNFYKQSNSEKVTIPVKTAVAVQPFVTPVITNPHQVKVKYVANNFPLPDTIWYGYGDTTLQACNSVGGFDDGAGNCQAPFNNPYGSVSYVYTDFYTYTDLNSCPSGYSWSFDPLDYSFQTGSDTCTLIKGELAVQDGSYNLSRSATGFTQNKNDADLIGLNQLSFSGTPKVATPPVNAPYILPIPVSRNANINSLLSAMFITGAGSGVQAFGVDPNGKNTVYQINKRSDNGSDFYILQPTTLPDGTIGTNYQKLSISPNGLVESTTNVQTAEKLQVSTAPSPNPNINPYNDPAVDPLPVIEYPYIVPAGQTAPTYDPLTGVTPQLTPALNPVPYTSPTGNTSGSTFPSDYARQGEAKNAADLLAPKIDRIGDALVTQASATPDPTVVDETTMPTFDTTFDNLKGWRLPPHASVCPKPQMTLFGNNYTLSSHCDLLNNYGSPLHQAMVVVFSVLALFIVLRA